MNTDKEKDMQLQLDKVSFFLGESIPVSVSFKNLKNQVIVIDNPLKSSEVVVHLVDTSDHVDYFYTLFKMEVLTMNRKTHEYVTTVPPKEEIKIAPLSSFDFTTDVNERLYNKPGTYDLYLTDKNEQSNHLAIKIDFNELSVDSLLKISQNPKNDYSRRDWAMKWLQELNENYKLKLSLDEEPETLKAQNEIYNLQFYKDFSNWWKKYKDSDEMKKRLKEI